MSVASVVSSSMCDFAPQAFSSDEDLELMREIYKYPALRCARIARDSEKKIGDFHLTAETARELDQDQTAVLFANMQSPDRIYDKVIELSAAEYPVPWVVVVSSIDMARWWYGKQHGVETREITGNSEANSFWRFGNCWFTRLERLESLSRHPEFSGPIAGIILVDPVFRTQYARGLKGSEWTHSDRPELMNNFRKDLSEDGLRPPLLFMTCPPAKSINTLPAQRAYCLENLWYCDGSRLRVGPIE